MHSHQEIRATITKLAKSLGFDRVAILSNPEQLSSDGLACWLAESRHASMDYMLPEHHPRDRIQTLLPDASSAIVVVKHYDQPHDLIGSLRVARYAHGLDYHDVLRERLAKLADELRDRFGHTILSTRHATDSAPLLERELARLAGLGWVGKNTMLIDQRAGSFFFIAELLVDADLGAPPELPDHPRRCGTCSRCLDACPTNALFAPGSLDARRCISYLTIEHRGPIPRHLRPKLRDHIFGCDICQDVCPWNKRSEPNVDPAFAPLPAYRALSPERLLSMTRRQFNNVFAGSAIQRTRRDGMLRNAAVVLGNTGTPDQLHTLSRALASEPSPLVRLHIAWAARTIALRHTTHRASVLDSLSRALKSEPDPSVVLELERCCEELAHDLSSCPIDIPSTAH